MLGHTSLSPSSSSLITTLWKARGIASAVRAKSALLDCCLSLAELFGYLFREVPIAEALKRGLTNSLFFIFSVRAR
jgi:hypothetical protein